MNRDEGMSWQELGEHFPNLNLNSDIELLYTGENTLSTFGEWNLRYTGEVDRFTREAHDPNYVYSNVESALWVINPDRLEALREALTVAAAVKAAVEAES